MKSSEQTRILRETVRRVRKVRKLLGKGKGITQEQFAKRLGVKGPTVAGWERVEERYAPGPGALMKLVKAALEAGSIEDALWFWYRAGWGTGDLISLATPILQARQELPKPGEIIRFPETEKIPEGGYGLVGREQPISAPGIVLSARFAVASRPQGYVLDKKFVGAGFPAIGDRILLDWSLDFGEDLQLFLDHPVLIELEPLVSDGRILDYSLHFGLLRKEAAPGGRSQAILHQPMGDAIIVGISNADGELGLLSGVRILGRAFGWLRAPQTQVDDGHGVSPKRNRVTMKRKRTGN